MDLLRTPEDRFDGLTDYPFEPHWLEIPFEGRTIRMHHLDEGDPDGEVVVLLHGEPSWSFLYRKVIPPLVAAGHRVIAPDLVGFGKSDKPTTIGDYTYDRQVTWLRMALFDLLDLSDITLYAQDWGGLLSLRLVAFEPERFARVMIANTGLPAGGDSNFVPADGPRRLLPHLGARAWKLFARWTPVFPIGRMAQALASESRLTPEVRAGYDAPFPSNRYKAGARAMPQLIPLDGDSPDARTNREAWARLGEFDKPFRTAFSDRDHAARMLPVDEYFQAHVPGAAGQRHVTIHDAGHFLQEDQGPTVAAEILAFMAENPLPQSTEGRRSG
ncbi:MAG: haloalkane dehalogenase [Acidimicrobiia bacterium]